MFSGKMISGGDGGVLASVSGGLFGLSEKVGNLGGIDKLYLSPILNLAVQGGALLLEVRQLLAAF